MPTIDVSVRHLWSCPKRSLDYALGIGNRNEEKEETFYVGAVVSGSAARGLAGSYTPARRATIGATLSRLLSDTT